MDILKQLQIELGIKASQVENTVKLLDEGNTVPFIARYRKEVTGSLDDQIIRQLAERLTALRNLEEKREMVRNAITEQGAMTDELSAKLEGAMTQTEIEDIYRPYRPKRRTRASIAKEKGLAPLAEYIFGQAFLVPLEEYAAAFVDAEKGVESVADAINGAKDILAEQFSDDADLRKMLREETMKFGQLVTKAAKEQTEPTVYEMYYDYSEPLQKAAGHRILAVNRGEKEGILTVKLEGDEERLLQKLERKLIRKNSPAVELLQEVIADSYKRLIAPSLEREIRNDLTEKAEESAMGVFRENLKQLLLQPPIKGKTVLALDPAYRTGCKIAVIDETGKPLETTVVYPTPPQNKTAEAEKKLTALIKKYDVDLISIGNGTASRESEQFVAEMLKKLDKKVYYIIANEAGASVYSASKLGAEEFPDYDVALRSAVSIGRRIQDPLAELVKIDPKSIGVGQYQHDVDQTKLKKSLDQTVENCVNQVGVNLNTASSHLLTYISGLGPQLAQNIVSYRAANGAFSSRKELMKVPRMGAKAFEQCAGFLRIAGGENPLDNTAVHPESYGIVNQMAKDLSCTVPQLIADKALRNRIEVEKYITPTVGLPTLKDILQELDKPGRDPRDTIQVFEFDRNVRTINDLREGMVLPGIVSNITNFGAFVDIGIKENGLVHLSQLANRFITDPTEVVSIHQHVTVKVLSIDFERKRIQLTMNIE